MVWQLLDKISNQVLQHTTPIGQVWYVIVFIFRLIVVITLGGAVYGDEQGQFLCSTSVIGCKNACFNEFTAVSHLRFWGFQLLAVASPTIFFHSFILYMTSQIEKYEKTNKMIEDAKKNKNEDGKNRVGVHEQRKMARRKKIVGNYRKRLVYDSGELKEVPLTEKITVAYFLTTIARMAIEGAFLHIGFKLYNNQEHVCVIDPDKAVCDASIAWQFLLLEFPAYYGCTTDDVQSIVGAACYQHVALPFPGQRQQQPSGFVPCWTSRPWEKTLFLRYMSNLSAICFLLCGLELIYIPFKALYSSSKKRKHENIENKNRRRPRGDDYDSSIAESPARDHDLVRSNGNYPQSQPDMAQPRTRDRDRSRNYAPQPPSHAPPSRGANYARSPADYQAQAPNQTKPEYVDSIPSYPGPPQHPPPPRGADYHQSHVDYQSHPRPRGTEMELRVDYPDRDPAPRQPPTELNKPTQYDDYKA